MYFLTSPNMDAMKQRWISELVKYDFSLEYLKGKNNTVADALSRISEERLSDEEAEKVLEAVPVVPGDDTIFKVFKEKEEDRQPVKAAPTLCLLRQLKLSLITWLQEPAGEQS